MIRLFRASFKFTGNYIKNVAEMSTVRVIQSQKIDIDGQPINYVKIGNGPKNIVCLPGVLGTIWTDFKPQVNNLDKSKFTVVVWDPPGYGFSRPPNRHFNTEFYMNDAICAQKFMKKIGIDKYSVLGWSDGGITGLIMAARFPDNIEKLIVWGSNSYVTQVDLKVCDDLRDLSKWSDKMKAPLIELYTEKGLQDMWNAFSDTLREIYDNGGNICSNLLNDINCPVFILHGDKDPMIAPEHPGYLLSKIKDAKLHRYPDGKHNIHLKYAEDFNKLVSDFLLQ
ncbi:valacyclovir hydrolase [Diorhabda carinulata]|uniref:valacyclovir hydrolase n=1 Tax=Diorhabda carinulata TaxID=1163345 RepID=UPI0025A2BF90|nr:valacyclovir hydrolase [Diorhabda carinulata]